MDKSWILDDLSAALARLGEALRIPVADDVVKAGTIQYFEFSFELAWKAIKIISEDLGLPPCLSPKACLRAAFTQGWIDQEDLWLEMLDARNRMAHTYDAARALSIHGRLADYLPPLELLLTRLRAADSAPS